VSGVETLALKASDGTVTTYPLDDGLLASNNKTPMPVLTTIELAPNSIMGNVAPAVDPDGHELGLSVKSAPAKGQLTISGSTFTFAAGSATGLDSFTVEASDGFGGTVDVTVAVKIVDSPGPGDSAGDASGGLGNLPPFAGTTLVAVKAGTSAKPSRPSAPFRPLVDPEKKLLTYKVLTAPAVGTLTGKPDGTFVYTPPVGKVTKATARLRGTDPDGAFGEVTVTFAIGVTLVGNKAANTLTGGIGNDVIKGLGKDDTLRGHDGNDSLAGGSGRDRIDGGPGNDRIDGGSGSDTMVGGPGADTYVVDAAGDKITEPSGSGRDMVEASVSYVLPAHVERLRLRGSSPLKGTGNGLANEITGNAAQNTLDGKGGADLLAGRAGADVLTGGAGADTFRYASVTDSKPATPDTITDFATTHGDQIDVQAIDADAKAGGRQPFSFIGTSGFSGKPGQLRARRTGSSVRVEADRDGDRKADLAIVVPEADGREASPCDLSSRPAHSTVTLLARLRGWSTSVPISTAVW
jgi:Ca2+-binding RTX toxin-like protein